MDQDLSEIKSRIEALAEKLGAPPHLLPTYGYSEESARPEIQRDARGYHFVVSERGNETERHTSFDLDEILYHVFDGVTFDMACTYAKYHRKKQQDFRRSLFARQEKLLTQLSSVWGERKRQDHAQVLEKYPFNDHG